MQFSTLIPSLTSNKIDIIAAAMYITPPRKEVIDFSGPVYTYGEGLIVPKSDAKDYKDVRGPEGRDRRRAEGHGLSSSRCRRAACSPT